MLEAAGIATGVEAGDPSDEREEDDTVIHGAVLIAAGGGIWRNGGSARAKGACSGSEQKGQDSVQAGYDGE